MRDGAILLLGGLGDDASISFLVDTVGGLRVSEDGYGEQYFVVFME